MITDITTDTATIILAMDDMTDSAFYRLNDNLGSCVIAEVEIETENFVKFNIDYSIIEYDNIQDAEQEAHQIYKYMLEFFGITEQVNLEKWNQERIQYFKSCYQEYLYEYGADDHFTQCAKKRMEQEMSA